MSTEGDEMSAEEQHDETAPPEPTHPIYFPPGFWGGSAPWPGYATPPIYVPVPVPPGFWGGSSPWPGYATPPIAPGGPPPWVSHPIPPTVWPNPPVGSQPPWYPGHPEHPIPPTVWPQPPTGGGQPPWWPGHPEHPIPPEVGGGPIIPPGSGELPSEPGKTGFYVIAYGVAPCAFIRADSTATAAHEYGKAFGLPVGEDVIVFTASEAFTVTTAPAEVNPL
jgi:hypothetical protein